MKRVIVILLMLLAAADLLSAAALSSESGFKGIHGSNEAVALLPGTDTKNVEDRMADALARLDSWKKALAQEKAEPIMGNIDQTNLTQNNSTSGNSTLNNDSINTGSSSEGRFKGYYGMTASRHEMGKSGINSHMFLSGNFEMDKTVKFQDQGID